MTKRSPTPSYGRRQACSSAVIAARALAFEPANRWPSANVMRVVVQDVLAQLPGLRQMAEDSFRAGQAQLIELLDSLRVTGPVDLMGLSFGGFVTGHYVPGHVARVRTLTLVDPEADDETLAVGAADRFRRRPR